MPLTDAHLVLLSAASQHDQGLLPPPAKLVGAARTRMADALIRSALVEPVPVLADQPYWRTDEAETPIGLRITPAGLTAIGVETATDRQQAAGAACSGYCQGAALAWRAN